AGSSRPIVAEVPVVSANGGIVTEITEFPENTRGVRIEYVRTGSKGSLAIDDVTVGYGIKSTDAVLPAYDGITTGYTDSYKVEGLDPGCDYVYKVAATDGNRTSRHSDLVKVTTLKDLGPSGIVAAEATETGISLSGRELTATADGTITVTTISGQVIACGVNRLHLTLPTSGIYIVATPAGAKKILIHD
ncbi:MAG: fibronectin type III domain-containing protein, partial [Duncaniella sp.]|nr:fibronectin type III domain-containing protein [Duncaniella sp.]